MKTIFSGEWESISNIGASDGFRGDSIWVICNPRLWKGVVLDIKRQHITLYFENTGGLQIYITVVYVSMEERDKRELWDDLVEISRTMVNKKWLVLWRL